MGNTVNTLIVVIVLGAAYLGVLYLIYKKVEKDQPKEPHYGSEYSEMLANSDGFHHHSLSD